MIVDTVATAMFQECLREEQSARRVPSDDEAARVRAEIRRLAKSERVRIRTARMAQTVVVARLDAQIWNDDRPTMRAKLTPR